MRGPADCCPGLDRLLEPEFFRALCDPSRLAVLARTAVRGGAATVSEIADGLPVSLSVVSRHLGTLRRAGILEAGRTGKEVRYRVRYAVLVQTLRQIADAVEACCAPPSAPAKKERR